MVARFIRAFAYLPVLFLQWFGKRWEDATLAVGDYGVFIQDTFGVVFKHGVSFRKIVFQANTIGVDSWKVVALTGVAIGAVLSKHSYDGLHRFGVENQYIGPLVYISMLREFGAIVSAIMLTARAGSAMTAELGSMKITEQVDALETLSINPLKYLVAPRIIGSTFIMPFLSLVGVVCGVGAGYCVAVMILGVSPETYTDSIVKNVEIEDIYKGLLKAAIFGFIASSICCYKGMNTSGGSQGVGINTTSAVVYSCVIIFLANFFLTSLLFRT